MKGLVLILGLTLCCLSQVYAGSASVCEEDSCKAYRKDGKTVIIYTNKQHIYVKKNHKKGEHTTITKTTKVVVDKKKTIVKTNTKKESYKHGEKKKTSKD